MVLIHVGHSQTTTLRIWEQDNGAQIRFSIWHRIHRSLSIAIKMNTSSASVRFVYFSSDFLGLTSQLRRLELHEDPVRTHDASSKLEVSLILLHVLSQFSWSRYKQGVIFQFPSSIQAYKVDSTCVGTLDSQSSLESHIHRRMYSRSDSYQSRPWPVYSRRISCTS